MESQIHEIQMMAERQKQKEAQEMARIQLSCAADHMAIAVDECLYNYDTVTLGLNDESCTAEKEGSMYKINANLDACENIVQTVGDELIFRLVFHVSG